MDKVVLAYDFNLMEFQAMFPNIEVYSERKHLGKEIDLLIFPGGEDVDMRLYAAPDAIQKYKHLCSFNPERDQIEANILYMAMSGKMPTKKILGICRGTQFLNVMFSGTLFADLASYGKDHHQIHDLVFMDETPLSFLSVTNSYHHQAIMNSGDYYRSLNKETIPHIIAVEKKTRVIEMITWFNGKVLGVQSHPEYFHPEMEEYKTFKKTIEEWVDGKKI